MTDENLVERLYAADGHATTGPHAECHRLFFLAAREIERLTRERNEWNFDNHPAWAESAEYAQMAATIERLTREAEGLSYELERARSHD
jgi:hypothetical protein